MGYQCKMWTVLLEMGHLGTLTLDQSQFCFIIPEYQIQWTGVRHDTLLFVFGIRLKSSCNLE
jgi:hypothetical protein